MKREDFVSELRLALDAKEDTLICGPGRFTLTVYGTDRIENHVQDRVERVKRIWGDGKIGQDAVRQDVDRKLLAKRLTNPAPIANRIEKSPQKLWEER
jgi:hypothetical protein